MAGPSSLKLPLSSSIYIDGEKIPPQTIKKATPIINYDDKCGVTMSFSKKRNKHYLKTYGDNEKYLLFGNVDLTDTNQIEIVAATAVEKGLM
jgi:hypothetical protein